MDRCDGGDHLGLLGLGLLGLGLLGARRDADRRPFAAMGRSNGGVTRVVSHAFATLSAIGRYLPPASAIHGIRDQSSDLSR